jgi:very-short-patch-repair endonuclease
MTNNLSPIEYARLRRQMSDEWERLLWQLLRNRQIANQKFRREQPLGEFTADFYCAAAKLVVEVDGSSHMSEEAKQYDARRTRWMEEQGIRVLRFTCAEVEHETEKVIEKIKETLNSAD